MQLRTACFLLIWISILAFPQQRIGIDTLKLKNAQDILGDDYGNIYLYKKKDFSLIKYDSTGAQLAKAMMPFPYKIQSVINPLNITMFSENAQEIKFMDQNLNVIQTISLSPNFGFVRAVYAEDLQFAWLIDDSSKTLVQYNFRSNTVINSFPFNTDLQALQDFLVHNNRIYILQDNSLKVYNTRAALLFSSTFRNGKKLSRNNDDILIFGDNTISKFDGKQLTEIFRNNDAKIVDKNTNGFLALIRDKLYLYKLK